MSAYRKGFRRGFSGLPTSRYRASKYRGLHGGWRRPAVIAVVAFVAVDAYLGYRLLRNWNETAPAPAVDAGEPVAEFDGDDQAADAERVQIGVPTISDRQVARLERQQERDERRGDGSRSDHEGSAVSDAGGTAVTTTSGSSSSTVTSGSDDAPPADSGGSDDPAPTDDGATDDGGGGSGGGDSSDGSGDDGDDGGGGGPGGGG
jgi:hypothetical protein